MRLKMSKMKEMTGSKKRFLMSLVRKIIKHRPPMQTEKYQPEGKRIMPEFPALSVDPRVGISLSASKTGDRFCLSCG